MTQEERSDYITSDTIKYLAPDGSKHIAKLETTDVRLKGLPGENASDPDWIDTCNGSTATSPWLAYMSDNGEAWKVFCHTHWNAANGWIEVSLEHQGADTHTDTKMYFRDWDGHVWTAHISTIVGPPFPAQPFFRLKSGKNL